MIDTVVDAGVAMAPADAAQVAIVTTAHPTTTASHPVAPPIQHPTQHPTTTAGSHDHDRNGGPDFNFGVDDGSRRHTTPPPAGTGSAATPTPTNTNSGSTGVSGTDGPLDPYNQGGVSDPGDAAAPEKKAEFYASLGAQQLASSDTAGAAASFKKALELDGKNVAAVSGMGEIALRQGLFGDAIAHLKKAARLAPKSSNVFTLLGEAYLNSGQNSVAAENFKKALQLDPDNKRAREGYDDASSKVPPPTDE
jgi:Tetratricopeptide repeat